jgi:integral membrane protein
VSDKHPIDDVTSDEFYENSEIPSRAPSDDAGVVGLSGAISGAQDAEDTDAGSDGLEPWITLDDVPSVRGALLRYRVMAYVVGTLLVILVCIAMPLKYFADMPQMVSVVGVAHGWLYALLLITAYMLGRKAGWPLSRVVVIALAGTVPFLSFVAEHYARTDVNRRIAETEAYYSDPTRSVMDGAGEPGDRL